MDIEQDWPGHPAMSTVYTNLKQRGAAYEWYWHRARSMSGPELVHRAKEQSRRFTLRFKRSGWRKFDVPYGNLQANHSVVAALSAPLSRAHRDLLTREVDKIRSQGITLLGVEWSAGVLKAAAPELWLQDPITGEQWPGKEKFCFDVNYRNSPKHSDVKFIWELNRLQVLHPVAFLAFITGDRSDIPWIMDAITSWMEANPPFRGVNWASGIEISLRLVSIAIVVACIGTHLTPDQKRQLRTFVAAHGYWLQRNPSLYSSANNHRVAEGLGLLMAAQLLPDSPTARQCLDEALFVLRDAVRTQFFSDGVGVEQSPSYSAFTLEMLAFAALVLKGTPEERHLHASLLQKPADALRCFLNERGLPPNIGDNDETRVISGPLGREPKYVASVIAAVEGLSGNSTAPPPHDASIRDLLFGSSDRYLCAETKLATFAVGGYTTYQEFSPKQRIHLVFDHGPLGFEAIAAHGHADALALWLSLDGDAVLADCGTYLYYSIGPFRDRFRSTGSHSTLQIAENSQSQTAGAFNWRRKAVGRLVRSTNSLSDWEIEGEHDGYVGGFGAVHRRRLSYDGEAINITDQLTGSFHHIESCVSFILDTSVVPELQNNQSVVLRRGGNLLGRLIFSGHGVNAESISLSSVPFSPNFNCLTSTTRIDVRVNTRPGDMINTRIVFN